MSASEDENIFIIDITEITGACYRQLLDRFPKVSRFY